MLAHAKDVRDDGTGIAAGPAASTTRSTWALLRGAGYDGPLVLHGLREDEVPEAVEFVRAHLGVGARA